MNRRGPLGVNYKILMIMIFVVMSSFSSYTSRNVSLGELIVEGNYFGDCCSTLCIVHLHARFDYLLPKNVEYSYDDFSDY